MKVSAIISLIQYVIHDNYQKQLLIESLPALTNKAKRQLCSDLCAILKEQQASDV